MIDSRTPPPRFDYCAARRLPRLLQQPASAQTQTQDPLKLSWPGLSRLVPAIHDARHPGFRGCPGPRPRMTAAGSLRHLNPSEHCGLDRQLHVSRRPRACCEPIPPIERLGLKRARGAGSGTSEATDKGRIGGSEHDMVRGARILRDGGWAEHSTPYTSTRSLPFIASFASFRGARRGGCIRDTGVRVFG